MSNRDILKNLNFCGYYDETKKYVIEIDKESAIKLLGRIIIRDADLEDYKELEDILKEELQSDIVKINY